MIQRIGLIGSFILCGYFNTLLAQDTTALRYSTYISGSTIKKHLSVLASDSLEGRETAQPGMEKASRYVSQQYEQLGLPAINNNSYYQRIPLINFSKGTSVLSAGDKILNQGDDYLIVDAPPLTEITADQIVFVGYGIVDSASGWNDYNEIDVSQKIVLMLEGEPVDKKGNYLISKSKTPSQWNSDRSAKIELAENKNAKAIFMVNTDYKKLYDRFKKRMENGRLGLNSEENTKTIPIIYMTPNAGDAFVAGTGKTIVNYKKEISKKKKPLTATISVKLKLSILMETTSCTNVLGYIEGSDLKNEVIVISAHLDHLGKRGDKIYYGADDDGSGSASILTLAEVFSRAKKEGHGNRRSLLFISFTGEEKGLLGSEYYSTHPIFPLENTVADLNIDMIGRVDTVPRESKNYTYLIGSDKLSSQLHKINEAANRSCCNLLLDYKYNDPSDKERLYYRSDHYNFAKNNIPVIFYFTGLHEDYHKPTDTIDKIDFEKTAGIVKLVFSTAWELANRQERITVDVVSDFK